jgi:hypothetical protein
MSMADGPSPRDFLLVHDRPARKPLQDWAGEVLRAVASLDPDGDDPAALSTCLNVGALIEASCGRSENAHHLCDVQLAWLDRLSAGHRDPAGVLVLAFQPWVNKGRLHGLHGRADDALRHFSVLADEAVSRPRVLGPCTITPETWTAIVERDPSVQAVLDNIYVVDSLKTFFRSGRYEVAHGFVERQRQVGTEANVDLLLEAQILSLAALGHFDEVVGCADSYSGSSLVGHLVFMLHRGAGLSSLGLTRESLAVALELSEFSRVSGLDAIPPPTAVRFLALLGRLLDVLGAREWAHRVHEQGLDLAHRMPDQPSQVAFLDALLGSGTDSSRSGWNDERARVLEGCQYRDVRRAAGMGPAPADPVFDELRSSLLAATGLVSTATGLGRP